MTNDFKTAITQNLEKRIVTISNTIVAISSQGYVVNNTKFFALKVSYNSFTKFIIIHKNILLMIKNFIIYIYGIFFSIY